MADEPAQSMKLLVADIFEAAGALRRQGEATAKLAGQTQARWQVMSVLSDGDWTVPRIGGRLGITRQSVQRVVDELSAEGLIRLDPNPRHERSPLVRLTERGAKTFEAIDRGSVSWAAHLAAELGEDDLAAARRAMRRLVEALSRAKGD